MSISMIPVGSTVVAATASSVAGTLPASGKAASSVYVYNDGAVLVWVRVGPGAQVAVNTDFPLGSKQAVVLSKGQGVDGVAAIGSAAGPSNVYFAGIDGN